MKFNIPNDTESERYEFKFYKEHIFKKKHETLIETEGVLNLSRKQCENIDNSISCIFETEKLLQKGIKDPLIFSPVLWNFNINLNMAGVNSKEELKLIWNRFKNKYRKQDNLVGFMVLENLYFNTIFGLEYSSFSHSPYLLFFINIYKDNFEENDIIKGLDWILMPMSIPVNTTFKCLAITDKSIILDGWVTLDEEKLEEMFRQKKFREQARGYHYSKDFNIDSKIKVIIDSRTSSLLSASFDLEINGEQGQLFEKMKYEIKRNSNTTKTYNVVIGKPRFLEPYG